MAKSRRSKTRAAAKSAVRKTSKTRKAASKKSATAKSAKAKSSKAKSTKTKSAKTVATKSRRATTARASQATRGKAAAKQSARSPARRAKLAPVAAKTMRAPHRVAVSHYSNAEFESGLRSYAQYRDLGIVDATDGMVRAHVLRFTEPCDPEVVSKLHFHDTEFQMVYVLKGWVKTELEGQGEIIMRQGSAWTQPSKIKHKINDYSEDAELLEIILPADFGTEELTG